MLSTSPTTVILCTPQEAETRHARIESGLNNIGRDLIEQRESGGWQLLTSPDGDKYASWTDYLRRGFSYSRKHLYELMNAADVTERLQPLGYRLNTSQANALAAYPQELQIAIVETAQNRYQNLTESNIKRAGDVLTQAVTTGHVDVGDDATPTPIDAALTREDEEATKRQKQYVNDNAAPKEYHLKAEQMTVDSNGRIIIYGLPVGAVVRVSVWSESDGR